MGGFCSPSRLRSFVASTPQLRRCYASVSNVNVAPQSDLQRIRHLAITPAQPILLRESCKDASRDVPARTKWFQHQEPTSDSESQSRSYGFSAYMDNYADAVLPFELIYPQLRPGQSLQYCTVLKFCAWLKSRHDPTQRIFGDILKGILDASPPRPDAATIQQPVLPLALLFAALEFNQSHQVPLRLYVAQADIPSLPADLQSDLPPPDVVRLGGKGDVYNSSVWLGTEPTFTPWHRDPNPNYFLQLCSTKTVRLMPPGPGEALYRRVQAKLRSSGNSRIRGAEMMVGPERALLEEAVWAEGVPGDMISASLSAGDALYIPNGWWHSVKSSQASGNLNASVNWWFR